MSDNDPEQRPSEPTGPIRWTQASWPATPSTAAQSTIDQMTDQLQSVIGAAERAAEAIRRDAEEQARLHLAEAQRKADRLTAERVGLISELTDDLIRHAENVRDHSEQMVRALEAAIDSVTDKLEQPALSDWLDGPGSPPAFGAADPAAAPEPVAQPVAAIPHQPAPATPAAHQPPATPASAGVYTDIVGAPPPPPPAWAPAPVPPRSPLSATRHETVVGPPQPTPEAAAAAAAGADLGGGYGNSMQHPPVPDAEAAEPEQVTQALDRARQLADAGVDRETIIGVLRLWGIADPVPIVARALGER